VIVNFSKRVLAKLLSKKYRDAFVAENVRTGIAYQIRALRDQRNSMSQKGLGDLMGKPQSVVSRLEDPDYGKPTVQTLLEVAGAFDVALLVQFVTHREFLRRMSDVSPKGLEVDSFSSSQLEFHSLAKPFDHHIAYPYQTPKDLGFPIFAEKNDAMVPLTGTSQNANWSIQGASYVN
jgi:transcriptional regulator with XRE-family HTH domain